MAKHRIKRIVKVKKSPVLKLSAKASGLVKKISSMRKKRSKKKRG